VCKNQAGAVRFSPILNFLPETKNFSHPYVHAAALNGRFGATMPENSHNNKSHRYFIYPIEKQKTRICRRKISQRKIPHKKRQREGFRTLTNGEHQCLARGRGQKAAATG
jgi:hypothetical protein